MPLFTAFPAGTVLGYNSYTPASDVSYSTTSSSMADVDATNAQVTFTAPPSGIALISATFCVVLASGVGLDACLRSASSTVSNTTARAAFCGLSSLQQVVTCRWVLAGLSGSNTLKLGFARGAGASSCEIHAGTFGGPLLMTAQAL